MVVFSNFFVLYFGLNYASLFCVILVSGRRRVYIYVYIYILGHTMKSVFWNLWLENSNIINV